MSVFFHELQVPSMIGFQHDAHLLHWKPGQLIVVPGSFDDHIMASAAVHGHVNPLLPAIRLAFR